MKEERKNFCKENEANASLKEGNVNVYTYVYRERKREDDHVEKTHNMLKMFGYGEIKGIRNYI